MKDFKLCIIYEFKKYIIKRNGWIMILCAVLIQIAIVGISHHKSYNYDTNLYRQYIEIFGGVYSDTTKHAIIKEKETIDQFISGHKHDMEYENSVDLTNQMILANEQSNVLSVLINKYQLLESCKEWNPVLSYDLELSEYIKQYHLNWAAMLFILIGIPLLILDDYNCGMTQILFPSRMGQIRIMCAKICVGSFICIIVTTILTTMQWILFSLRWDFGQLDIPIQSLTGFETSGVKGTIGQYLLLGGVLRVFAVIPLSFLICFISAYIRKETVVITSSVSIITCSAAISSKYTNLSSILIYTPLSGISALQQLNTRDYAFLLVGLCIKTILYGFLAGKVLFRKPGVQS